MGIKYIIAEQDDVISPLYEAILTHNNDLIAYKNPYALSIAFGVNETLSDFIFDDEQFKSPFERMNALLGEMVGSEKPLALFQKVKTDAIDYKNCAMSMVVGHKKYAPEDPETASRITFTIKAPNDKMLYCYFSSDYPRECDMYVNGESVGTYFGNETFAIRPLGYFEKGEEIKISLTLKKNDLYLATNDPYFFWMDDALFTETMDKLSLSQFEIEEYDEDSFYGTIHAAEDQTLVYTSIPYDEGWIVKVDGEEVETVTVVDALMGFRLPSAGEHTVSIEYWPDCVQYGLILCAGGLSAFAVIWIGDALVQRHKKKKGMALS
jgi:uncharacterized membrane protein YfhO